MTDQQIKLAIEDGLKMGFEKGSYVILYNFLKIIKYKPWEVLIIFFGLWVGGLAVKDICHVMAIDTIDKYLPSAGWDRLQSEDELRN
jgi:hypothetical protein